MSQPPSVRPPTREPSAFTRWLTTLGLLVVSCVFAIPFFAHSSDCGRSADSSNVHQIAQASAIYAVDHHDLLPVAIDVWDYAGKIATGAGLDIPNMWLSHNDPARTENDRIPALRIIEATDPAKSRPSPNFRKLKLAYAVPLFPKNILLRPTLPIVWTRGLQPDGTWAAHAPRHPGGGLVGFAGGQAQSFNTRRDGPAQFARFDGDGYTTNILEALPPGTRVGQYEPTDAERIQWANTNTRAGRMERWSQKLPAIFFSIVWFVLVLLSIWLWLARQAYVVLPFTVIFLAVSVLVEKTNWLRGG